MKQSGVAAALLAVLLFASGVGVGVFADRYFGAKTASPHSHPSADQLRREYVADMQKRLNLSPDQVTRLNTLLDDTHRKFKAFRDEHRAEFERINQEQINSVRSILRPDQVPAYDKLVAEREKHRHEHDR